MARRSAPPRTTPTAAPLPPRAQGLLLGAFLGGALLNLHHLALWVFPVALLAALWRWRRAAAGLGPPPRAFRYAALAALTLAVLASFRTLNGLAAGASLLTTMGALKLLEATRPRDHAFVLGAAFFLLLAACLDAQALWRVPLYAADLWIDCAALIALARPAAAGRAALRASGRLLLLAAPLALLLFLFFPRLPGAFWALPESGDAVTGLGSEMEPGSIARLAESDDPAMRVRFTGPVPPPAERYWRGPVLHDFDGRRWRARPGLYTRRTALAFSGPLYHYQVALEPGPLDVLPALEMPVGPMPPQALLTSDYQLVAPQSGRRQRDYALDGRTHFRAVEPLSTTARRVDLALPADRNPRSVALGREIGAAAPDARAAVAAALERFRRGGFVYTMQPQRLGADPVDEFLFGTRAGFCGHYASAFVTLMRAAGIPARVVTGYQGGDWNPFGGYFLVRQSHAHAWAEVWIDSEGWTRVDPTAVVAPGRLTGDTADVLAGALGGSGRLLRGLPWLTTLAQGWDALDSWWQDDVVGFTFKRQLDLLGRLGFDERDGRWFGVLLAGGGIAWAALIAWSQRQRLAPVRVDPAARAWLRLGRRLARVGLARRPHEGPLDYAERVAAARPALAKPMRRLAREYARLRYGGGANPAALRSFERSVRGLDVGIR